MFPRDQVWATHEKGGDLDCPIYPPREVMACGRKAAGRLLAF